MQLFQGTTIFILLIDIARVNRIATVILCIIAAVLWSACSTKKNTALSRRYHAFTSRYNIYFNGKTSFDESLAALNNGHQESYTEQIHMFPVSALPKEKVETGGVFDRAIEKGNKAIKLHSIRRKPERKAGWRNDARQTAIQEQNEYNPFLKHCWLLIGQGQFYNADFLQASATFSYIARHYGTDPVMVAEARIWQARCYAEINWLHEAGSILDNLRQNGIPDANRAQYERIYADWLIKSDSLDAAIPYLQKAIGTEKNRNQRIRMNYLLGQLYAATGRNADAYRTFGRVARSTPPYALEFAARIRQTEVIPGGKSDEVLRMLNRMARSEKNANYLDQVYYAIGNIHMERKDTAKAIESYALGIEKSTQEGLNKAICQIRLGDIYFTQKDYIKAQPCFSGALAGLYKEYKDYGRVSQLSAVLDELVVHAEAVHLQDSLQTLAKLPEKELLALIDKKIEEVKKREEEEAAEREKERYLAEQEGMGNSMERQHRRLGNEPTMMMPGNMGGSSFYFYNSQTVAQGKVQFQNRWGKRPLEDHWRRRTKSNVAAVASQNEPTADIATEGTLDAEGNPMAADSAQLAADSLAGDPKSRQFYLQQIPFDEEDLKASNLIIADGLYNMGMIYKDKLENMPLAVDKFEELERRFPDNSHRLEYYFQSFLMGLRYRDNALRDQSIRRLQQAFPKEDYTTAASDPAYESNIRTMGHRQDSIYEQTYTRYLASDTIAVRRLSIEFEKTYPLSELLPKFIFLKALTYAQSGNAAGFRAGLDTLVARYPKADVAELAQEMLKGLLRGRTLMQGDFTGMKWNLRFGVGEDGIVSATDSARRFTNEPQSAHLMVLLYETGSIDRNQLLYAVAAYNFAHYESKIFDLTPDASGPLSMLLIGGFANLDEVLDYTNRVFLPDGYANAVQPAVTFLPISQRNYETLLHGKTLEEYIAFFAEEYADRAPALLELWKKRFDPTESNPAVAAAEDNAVEQAAEIGETTEPQTEPTDTLAPVADSQPIDTTTATQEIAPIAIDTTAVIIPDTIRSDEPTDSVVVEPADSLAMPVEHTDSLALPDSIQPAPTQPKAITLDYLLERRRQQEQEADERKAAEAKSKKEQLKAAEKARKQKAKEREQLRRQKEKEAKERLKQKEQERKEKARERLRQQKEKEAQRKAEQKAKEAQRKAARKGGKANKQA